MKATALLEAQHRTVEALFEKLECGQGDRAATLVELARNLVAHMVVEQEIFYPAIKQIDEELVNESYEEHALGELALRRVLATSPVEPTFKARVTALKELIEHHVSEEEEELFPQVEEAIDDATSTRLAKLMKARFGQVYETGIEEVMPKSTLRTSADAAQKTLAKMAAQRAKPATV
jgi:hemerythrin superfamily protein